MKQSEPVQRGSGLSQTDSALLAAPLEFISEDHMRERQVCAVIDRLVTAVSFDRQAVVTVLRYLNEELNVHMRDEAEDLFPLLVARCTTDDAIDQTIARIKSDLDAVTGLLPEIRGALLRCLDAGSAPSSEEVMLLTRFVGHVRRHLAVENAILLPIARARLTRRDLTNLSQRMLARRGLTLISKKPDAEKPAPAGA